ERMPTYKDQIEKLKDKDLATYGFLGYPLLQAADILIYKASHVPVGEDQAPHVEITREVARRFNHLYGRAPDHAAQVAAAIALLSKDDARYLEKQRKAYGQDGSAEALAKGEALVRKLQAAGSLDDNRTELLLGHLKGTGRSILTEPDVLLTETSKLPGLDGDKMAKSRNNSIAMRDDPAVVTEKVRGMKTDPARARRSDPGNPERCPVWEFHKVYTDESTRAWVQQGCTSAGIGCLDCKQPVIDAIVREQQPWRERAETYLANPKQIHWIVEMGTERARTVARQTMKDVREAMGLNY
ncbi:MAG TPA: tryptophan--tRNA ligase, partial [Aquabacterium sp.]|nr:tryptophan--tRNA ligase [Aquabacterium sp.]